MQPPCPYSSLILWDGVVALGSAGGIPIQLDRKQMPSSCTFCIKRRRGLQLQWHLPLEDRVLWNKDEVVVGSGDSKAAETQTGQGHSLQKSSPHQTAITSPHLHERKCQSACCLHKQNSGAQRCQTGPGGVGRLKTQSSVTVCSFPIPMLCRNNQELQEHVPAQHAWLQDCSLCSLIPLPQGRMWSSSIAFYRFLLLRGRAQMWRSA